ncbi:MAG: cell division protein ZapA [Novosphingobium sp.]|nr:cell division protein ZapA [Novosphingobium sp.]MCP5378812.1 cell division protein ZapA [Novosphingobium sp.]MCP5389691.1 cell division protein ZapA [Novosphingobium sp.]
MSNVTLRIGGRSYTVACAEGEEAHITRLGRMVDEKLTDLPSGGGNNELRSLLFASLILADELHDARKAAATAAPPPAPPTPAPAPAALSPQALATLGQIAQRIEILADTLEQAATTP